MRGNPKQLLRCIDQEALDAAAEDAGYRQRYAEVLEEYLPGGAPTCLTKCRDRWD